MGYYPDTVKEFRARLKRAYPGIKSRKQITNSPSKPPHLLWMLNQIKKMVNSSARAGRWIGYCARALEDLNLITNQEVRDLIREDVNNGYE